MESSYSWRRCQAHVVAIACFVQESLSFFGLLASAIALLLNGEEIIQQKIAAKDRDIPNKEYVADQFRKAIWGGLVVASLLSVVRLWAVYFLLKGTAAETDLSVALQLKYCKNWKIVTAVFLIPQVITLFTYYASTNVNISLLFLCIKDLAFLYIVNRFTDELSTVNGGNVHNVA